MLPFDVSRCWGIDCEFKDHCQRYVDRDKYGWNTPMQERMCSKGKTDKRIPLQTGGDDDELVR